jgi:nucleoside-diphosphate-sugar epimerase
MRVLITGAGGFIGSHLVEDQLNRGREVTAVDLHTDWLEQLPANPRLTILKGDFADRALLDSHLAGHQVCFHLASAHLEKNVGEEYFWQVNVRATREFIERCYQAGIPRFVHCSSVGVYGDIKNPPADEESDCHPDVAYEKSKLAGEKELAAFARECNYDLVVVRPAWVYGPRCPRTQKLFKAIQKRQFFYVGDGQSLRHPIYIRDMVDGFELAAACPPARGEVFIMAGPRAVTLEELANEIAACVGAPPPRLKLPRLLVWLGCLALEGASRVTGREAPFTRRSMKFYTGNTAFSIQKAQKVLGFDPAVNLRDGLQQTYSWLKESGRIR